jgi:hypothetical protein
MNHVIEDQRKEKREKNTFVGEGRSNHKRSAGSPLPADAE